MDNAPRHGQARDVMATTGRARDVDALLAGQDWGAVYSAVVKYAFHRTRRRSWELAEDLAQEAIRRVLDPAYVDWDPVKEPAIERHLGSIVNSLVANRTRAASTVRERSFAPAAALWSKPIDARPTPEEALEREALEVRALALLRARVAEDSLAAAIVEIVVHAGVDKPAALAEATGQAVEQIYKAQRRVAGHVAAVRRELEEMWT